MRVAAYLAKYAAKSAEDFGLGERRLAGRALDGVGGFRGHFATKSRRYSTTLGAIRRGAPTTAGASSAAPGQSVSTTRTTAHRWSAAGRSPASAGRHPAVPRARPRHTAATLLIAHGQHAWVIMEVLGHSQIAVTLTSTAT